MKTLFLILAIAVSAVSVKAQKVVSDTKPVLTPSSWTTNWAADPAAIPTVNWGLIIHEDGRIECWQCEGVPAGSVIGRLTPEGIKSVFGSPRTVQIPAPSSGTITPCLTAVTYPGTFTCSPSITTTRSMSIASDERNLKPKYAHAHIDDPKKEDPKPVAPIRIPAKQSMSLKAIDEEFQANERNYQIAKRDILQRWQIVTQQAAIEAGLTAKQLEGLEVTLGEGGYVWTPKKLAEKPVANTKP